MFLQLILILVVLTPLLAIVGSLLLLRLSHSISTLSNGHSAHQVIMTLLTTLLTIRQKPSALIANRIPPPNGRLTP